MKVIKNNTYNFMDKDKTASVSTNPVFTHNILTISNKPLNQNSQNLSFKGFWYKPVLDEATKKVVTFNTSELLDIAKKHLGSSAEDLFNSVQRSKLSEAKNMVSFDNGKITFQKKTIPHLIYDGIIYPVKNLPVDLLSAGLKQLGKIKPLQDLADKAYGSKILKNLRQKSKIESKVNALRGLFETIEKNKNNPDISSELFQQSVKMFDVKTGNYDTKHERSLCRIVSGSIPAFFLANDAYNLSIMYNNNKEDANKEQKARFKQELVRIGANAYLTLITLGALQKQINNNKLAIVLNTGLTVLLTETIARLSSGKAITRLTPEQAKAINAKNNKTEDKSKENKSAESKPAANTKVKKNNDPLFSFNTLIKATAGIIVAGFGIKALRKNKSVSKFLGDAAKPFKEFYKKLTVNPDYKISKETFNNVVKKLRESGFNELAQKYEDTIEAANKAAALRQLEKETDIKIDELFTNVQKEKFFDYIAQNKAGELSHSNKEKLDKSSNVNEILTSYREMMNANTLNITNNYKNKVMVQTTNDDLLENLKKLSDSKELNGILAKYNQIYSEVQNSEFVHLGAKDKKIKPLIDFVIAPFKFAAGIVKFPYKVTNDIIGIFQKKKDIKLPQPLEARNINSLAISIDKMSKAVHKKDFNLKDFKDYVDVNILKAFNVDNISNISNNELANIAKTSATAATLWFLMTDNYNMAMLKSNGEDKEGAEEKFKGRFVQEMSRLFYQTLLIDLFNNSFKSQYHSSLLGMSWVTAACTFISEILNRKSIGMPILPHTKSELEEIEDKKNNATGLVGSYYNFMARLTGKKTLAERQSEKK